MELLEKDLFQFGVPIEKSYQDENGDVIIEGIASAPQEDHQGEYLDPRGFVLDYFEKSGWIKWEHKGPANGPAAPDQFIGEPMEARITPDGQFYLKARLYKGMPLTQKIAETMDGLQKSMSTRKMGFSIEGQAIQRDPQNPTKVLKAMIRNVVLTMNPVNGGTWAQLAKSLTSPDALGVDLDPEFSVEKAMDTGSAAPLMPQSLEGNKPKKDEDETEKTLRVFSAFVKRALNKQLRKSLLDTLPANIAMGAYDHAVDRGLNHSQACEFAKVIVERRELLKSVLANAEQGGAPLMSLTKQLGETFDELEKSLNQEPEVDPAEQELDNLLKSLGAEEDQKGEGSADEDEEREPEDEEEGNKGMNKHENTNKSITDSMDLMKSLGDDTLQAIEVSDVLGDLVKSLDSITTGVTTRLGEFAATQDVLMKSINVIGKVMQTTLQRDKELTELVKSLQNQVTELGAKPVGRRSVTTQAEVQTATRQGGMPQPSNDLTKSQQMDLAVQAFEAGKIPMSAVIALENGYPMHADHARAAGILKG